MSGRSLFIGMFVALAVFAFGLFYTINYAYYTKTKHESFNVGGLEVTDYQEIDASTSPIKYRACFQLPAGTELYGKNAGATPLVAPYWFDCFDAKTLTEDLEAGNVNAVSYDFNQPFGVTSYMIVYPDGKGYAWRQLNECGEAEFSGDDLPENCQESETNNG